MITTGKISFFILHLFLCVTQFICSWNTWVAMCGSISHLIALDLFGLSHRTRLLLNTTTKQQNKSCFAKVLAKAVEGTPLQRERIRQTCKHQRKKFSRPEKIQAGKETEIQPAAQVEPGKEKGTQIHVSEGPQWSSSTKRCQNKCRTSTVVGHREDNITIPPLLCFACR